MTRWVTAALALIGLAIGIWAVATARQTPPELPLAREASVNPFGRGVAALGLIEPGGKDVSIVAPEAALVTQVFVDVNDRVQRGQALFQLDTRQLEAELLRTEAAVLVGTQEVERWHALPRAEDLPPLEAAIARAVALHGDSIEHLRLNEEAVKRGAGSSRDVTTAQYAVQAAQAEVDGARADLAKAKAGGWVPDLKIAEANLARLQAEVQALKLLLERLTVRAPREAVILRRSIEAGEYATTDPTLPAMIIGDLATLNVRAQVDEEDIGLVSGSPRAVARTRGAAVIEVPLRLLRIEPYARPKMDLSGTNMERVDTRVIDVVFQMDGQLARPVYPGQAVDVFIDAPQQDTTPP